MPPRKKLKTPTYGLTAFIHAESSGGIVMLIATALAMIAANGSNAAWYQSLIHLSVGVDIGGWVVHAPFNNWIKDVLMVPFFLLIGMELKREMVEGVLADSKQIVLPLLSALAGMAVPAAVFLLINQGIPSHDSGWAIASATDIAFALCVLTLAARRVPPALKIFLLALAIFDDLGAIVIIAVFYSHGIVVMSLLLALAMVGLLYALNRFNTTMLLPYLLTGIALCFFLHEGGIHTTIGGMVVGMAIPLRDKNRPAHSPLNRFMSMLHPWVSFLVLPLFAFTAGGIDLSTVRMEHITAPLTLGVMLGLFLGKQVGIFLIGGLTIALGFASLPKGSSWSQFYAVSLIAGIGFTMSLFIGNLAFSDAALQEQVKLGVLLGSLASACVGGMILRLTTR